MPEPLSPDQLKAVIAALDNGKVIEAIKLYREFAGCGLKEAKDAVDRMRADRDAKLPESQRRKSGCMGVMFVMAAIGLVTVAAATRWLA